MNAPLLVRFFHPDAGERLGLQLKQTIHDVTDAVGSVAGFLQGSVGRVEEAIIDLTDQALQASRRYPAALFDRPPSADGPHWLAPVDEQDVWACGVTYFRSRHARQEESVDGGDVYARVYLAERPELFFKARAPWIVPHFGRVGIRSDAAWSVPEPELGLVVNPALEIVGTVAGNDMSSRDIEGENPLYLPQAKIYTASCSLGQGLVLGKIVDHWPLTTVSMAIRREGETVFSDQTDTGQIRRRPDELVGYLGRCLALPDGAVLLTGTGIVPPAEFTLQAGDEIEIAIAGVGALRNWVMVV